MGLSSTQSRVQHNRFPQPSAGPRQTAGWLNLPLAFLIVTLFWALIYMTGLGSPELKGEEGRRILPAIEMRQSGDWIMPHIGGEPYLRKPPLVNWAIAGAMATTGQINEWSARLPSAVSVLVLALGMLLFCRKWLGLERSLLAALIALSISGMIGKGRLAEIEALFTALTGLSCIAWLAWREGGRSPWLYWTLPFIPMGLGCLTKGPFHLLFFYAMVFAVLGARRQWRELFHPAHGLGLVIMAAIVLPWLIPYRHATANLDVGAVLKGQTVGRFTGEMDPLGWALNIPRAASDMLPWVLFFPLLWRPVSSWDPAKFRVLRNVMLSVVVGLLLLPAVLPRYVMPAFPVFSVLLAIALCEPRGEEKKRWWKLDRWPALRIALVICGAISLSIVLFSLVALPIARKRDQVRPQGEAINQAVLAGQQLYVLAPGFQPVLFYVKAPIIYLQDEKEVPKPCSALLVRRELLRKLSEELPDVRTLRNLGGKGKRDLVLVSVGAANSKP